jgi:murein DD-endopeptidase MepM/ murein hydrolase activator NlpD
MANPRTFIITDGKPMKGKDVAEWQREIKKLFKAMAVDCPIKIDGIYAQATRSYSAALCYSAGLTAKTAMKNGVTPELRTKLRKKDLTATEKKARVSKARHDYRDKLRKRWRVRKVHAPVNRLLADSWGWHPGVHDGVDLISYEGDPAFAMVKSKVIDVRPVGWWGLGAPSNPALLKRGAGIVQLEVLENVGPFKKGMHLGYGHCVHARVRVGQVVQAGEIIALVGFANAAHIHFMVNGGNTRKGIGTQDPLPLVNYAVKNG